MDRLPPLNAVRAFEAAARHMSITLAADELNVTPGAVSRQVRSLEEFLGIRLLHRGHQQISLTRQGADYFRAVTKAIVLPGTTLAPVMRWLSNLPYPWCPAERAAASTPDFTLLSTIVAFMDRRQ